MSHVSVTGDPRLLLVLFFVAQSGCSGDPRVLKLNKAIASGDAIAITVILNDDKLDVNACGTQGMPPLLQALLSNDKATYLNLLDRGANPNLCDGTGRCVMNQAAKEGDSFWLREALERGGNPDAPNSGNRHVPGWTPLFYALNARREENVELLIKSRANLDHRDAYGVTPLWKAAEAGACESLVKLLEAGADPKQTGNHGHSFIDVWIKGRDDATLTTLDEREKMWFRKARDILIERNLVAPESTNQQ